jgi:hypothetical protein
MSEEVSKGRLLSIPEAGVDAPKTRGVMEELARIQGVLVRTPSAKSDHSSRARAALVHGTAATTGGRKEVAWQFRRRDLEKAGEPADVHRRRRF